MDMTNPGIPPVLSKAHAAEFDAHVKSLREEIDAILEDLDDLLAPTHEHTVPAAA